MAEEKASNELAEVRRELSIIKGILMEIRREVISDHHKIEELEENRKNLEMTGRINIRPTGL